MDWPALARIVAPSLLGEPASKTDREWRWGRRGSLTLYLDSGRLHDYETGESLGLLDLIRQYRHLADHTAAWHWLAGQGLVQAEDRPFEPQAPAPAAPPSPDPAPAEPERPFWQTDLPKLDYRPIPEARDHPLNLWADRKCARPRDAAWPAGCRWLRGWRDGRTAWGGDGLLVPLAPPAAWLNAGGVRQSDIRGVHVVFVAPDGRPRRRPDGRNKTSWANQREYAERRGSTAGCGFLTGRPEPNGCLALCEGVADALAIHWHLGIPALAACGELGGLVAADRDLAELARFHMQVRFEIWFDRDTKRHPQTNLRAGYRGAAVIWKALLDAGVPKDRLMLMEGGRDGSDPCDWLAALARQQDKETARVEEAQGGQGPHA